MFVQGLDGFPMSCGRDVDLQFRNPMVQQRAGLLQQSLVQNCREIAEPINLRHESPVCTENLIRVDAVTESPKLAE